MALARWVNLLALPAAVALFLVPWGETPGGERCLGGIGGCRTNQVSYTASGLGSETRDASWWDGDLGRQDGIGMIRAATVLVFASLATFGFAPAFRRRVPSVKVGSRVLSLPEFLAGLGCLIGVFLYSQGVKDAIGSARFEWGVGLFVLLGLSVLMMGASFLKRPAVQGTNAPAMATEDDVAK